LNLKDEYSESELEGALIQHLADFLLELGDDFAFPGRQWRTSLASMKPASSNEKVARNSEALSREKNDLVVSRARE
jgi:hypothetical protein